MQLSRVIYMVLGIIFAGSLVLTHYFDIHFFLYVEVAFAILLTVSYIFTADIDWWWWNRHPPVLDRQIIDLLEKYITFYQRLPEKDKSVFNTRLALFVRYKEFIFREIEKVPEDLQCIICAYPVMLTLHKSKKKYLFEGFDKIVVYNNPFVTPMWPAALHACESYFEDGVVMLSARYQSLAVRNPHQYFNISLYEWSRVFFYKFPENEFQLSDEQYRALDNVCGYTVEQLKQSVNVPFVDSKAVAIHHYFIYPDRFAEVLPELNEQLATIFNYFPIPENPPLRYLQ